MESWWGDALYYGVPAILFVIAIPAFVKDWVCKIRNKNNKEG